MPECENGNIVTDLLEGLALEEHQVDLLSRFGILDNVPDAQSLLGRLKTLSSDITSLNTNFINEDFASESTQQSVLTALGTIIGKLDTLVSESNDTQSLIGEVSPTPTANTILGRLRDVHLAVDGLEASLASIDDNTDQVETLITATNQAIADLQAANNTSGDDVVSAVNDFETSFNARDIRQESGHGSASGTPSFVQYDQQTRNFSTLNSFRNAATPAGFNFPGTIEDVSKYGTIAIAFRSTKSSAVDGARILLYAEDGSLLKVPEALTLPGTDDFGERAAFPVYFSTFGAKFFQLDYTNGSEVSDIIIDVHFAPERIPGTVIPLEAQIVGDVMSLVTKSVISGLTPFGDYRNARLDPLNRILTSTQQKVTQSGSTFAEGIRDDIVHNFSASKGAESLSRLVTNAATGGASVTHSATLGQLVIKTGATPGSVIYVESEKSAVYEPGHAMRADQTAVIFDGLENLTTGDAKSEIGFGIHDGSGNLLHAIGTGLDALGGYVFRIVDGVYENKVYQPDYNRDKLDGNPQSRYTRNGVPVAPDGSGIEMVGVEFEWLGVAPPTYFIMSPSGEPIVYHVEETPGAIDKPTVPDPEMKLFMRIQNDSTVGGVIELHSGSWRGGIYTNKTILMGKNPSGDIRDVELDKRNRILTGSGSEFDRILNRRIETGEEIRFQIDDIADLENDYIGVAPELSATSAAVWSVVRIYKNTSGQPTRIRFVEGIAWDDRSNAVHWP